MHELAMFLGRLAGTAVNPVLWAIVAAALYFTRTMPGLARIGIAVAATVVVGALFYAADDWLTMYEKVRGLAFAALAALLMASAWTGIRRLMRGRA